MRNKTLYILLVLLVIQAAGCRSTSSNGNLPPSSSTPSVTIPVNPLATPVASEPAAGICADAQGEIVDMVANPDVPDPRCMVVRPEQKLRVHNKTQVRIDINLGTFSISLDPGVSGVLDQRFGDYLEPGVHLVMVTPCCGGEIWLKVDN